MSFIHYQKMKNEGKKVSILTKIVVYGLLVLSLIMMYFSFLAFFIFSFAIFWLSSLSCSWRHDAISENCYCPCITIVITKSIIRQQKSDPDTPLIDHWLRLAVHILLIII